MIKRVFNDELNLNVFRVSRDSFASKMKNSQIASLVWGEQCGMCISLDFIKEEQAKDFVDCLIDNYNFY